MYIGGKKKPPRPPPSVCQMSCTRGPMHATCGPSDCPEAAATQTQDRRGPLRFAEAMGGV